ncbi:ABC transporter family substrate-binding protein [Pseudonocardia acaciae]|uniref:ABC transporter family substrate-binding protein n=1 Tax=Pseudonocardia acaciae TaxID=551276 RepID=UPI00048A6C62|nr:ABC transporter family substrate-binding protein [Pseudonocardia acaciae]
MIRPSKLALLGVLALTLVACGGGPRGAAPPTRALGQTDINPQPRENVRDGGDLRLPMQLMPSNFNYNQVDGPNGDAHTIDVAVLPRVFNDAADGGPELNTDYVTSADVTSTSPQVITYTINPKANWSDGTPITWRDFQAEWQALNGSNPEYQIAGTTGYADIASVARGRDDKQVVVTFARPFGEWQSLFTPLMPTSLNSNPRAFNTGWRTGIPITSGPFTVQSIDQTKQTIILARDPKWWGTPPKLDRIILSVYQTTALPDALANNELDQHGIGGQLDLLRRTQQNPNAVIRSAPGRFSFNVTLNGGAGAPLSDPRLRRAVAQGIDRAEITRRMLGQEIPNPEPDGSHIYAPGSKEYRDNAGVLPFDQAAANRELDALGWIRQDAGRVKDGKPLNLRLVYAEDPSNTNMAKTVQNELAQIGVTVTLEQVDGNKLFPEYVNPGNFDMALMGWQSTSTPFSSSAGIYQRPLGNNVQQNYGRIGSPEIDALIAKGLAELDDTTRADIANQADRLIWEQAHSLVLFAVPGLVAARKNVANFGARGFADPDFINAGFVK